MNKHNRKTAVIVIFFYTFIVIVGCQQQPTNTPTPTQTAVPPEPTALPDGQEALHHSQEAIQALPSVSIEGSSNNYWWPDVPPFSVSQTSCLSVANEDGDEAIQSNIEWLLPGDISEHVICEGVGDAQTCYNQIEAQPWFRDVTQDGPPTWLEDRRDILEVVSITEDVTLSDDGSLKIGWTRENWETGQLTVIGESWLEPDTLLPKRESMELYQADWLIAELEFTYSSCQLVEQPQPWPAPTVTPAPTIAPPTNEFEIREEIVPLPGKLYLPEGDGPFPAVIVLHGSEGGIDFTQGTAQRLARNGLAAFAFCYFSCPDAPLFLERIDLEPLIEAIAYLQNRPDTHEEKIGVLGLSRGAELALIIGTLDEAVGPVVSIMGSSRVNGALHSAEPAWLLQGKPLPFIAIPVETIDGPILLLHGQEDSTWPVSYSYIVAERLAANNHEYEMIIYPHRGHELGRGPRDVLNQAAAFLLKHLAP